ncbi:early nodulin-like protein 3 [Brachypodium distachyon]|uniref:Phytocyanin domain-containing protein n=1 Tax=Brachypodium distachyon TaxID=15368 RepID=I1I2H8_BRADI|nr:early nodulin-like protein 3 [Brachypodium distachyon]KQJ95877.1 hypothetical protein BRADI_3g19540v3 [Brachypodium distachyon]|eukprot:XP_003571601.1 early nodulin-like protein 3 [Brachypodium distachyon]
MASRAILLCVSLVLVFVVGSDAKDFIVAGVDGWKVPAQPDALNKWASANRFHAGDNLVFKFNGAADSVLEVTLDDYNRCSTASPIAAHKTSDATVNLPRSGPFYFISGTPGSCQKGERLIVVVMSEKHGRRSGSAPVPAAAPAPSALPAGLAEVPPAAAPAPAPATGAAGRAAGSVALLLGALLGGVLVGF